MFLGSQESFLEDYPMRKSFEDFRLALSKDIYFFLVLEPGGASNGSPEGKILVKSCYIRIVSMNQLKKNNYNYLKSSMLILNVWFVSWSMYRLRNRFIPHDPMKFASCSRIFEGYCGTSDISLYLSNPSNKISFLAETSLRSKEKYRKVEKVEKFVVSSIKRNLTLYYMYVLLLNENLMLHV